MPRNRTVSRIAVLGSPVQRGSAAGNSSTRSSALRRRLVLSTLIIGSLVLLTLSFRSTALDSTESLAASALRPFEVAANRVARPFQDAAGWTKGLIHAKAKRDALQREVDELRRQVSAEQSAIHENDTLRSLLAYRDSARFPQDFHGVAARVLTNPATSFDQTVTVDAGSNQGVAVEDVVVTADGLVGQVTRVFSNISRVMLITDPDSAVRSADANNLAAIGIVEHGSGTSSVVLSRVTKDKKVNVGDTVITAGSPGQGQLPSLFPRNINVGRVTSVNASDTDLFKQIQVQPFVDFSSLESVLVLIPKASAHP